MAVNDDARIFGENLRRERLRLDLSQEALGFLCELNTSEVSRLELARRDPRLATIIKLARALEVRPSRLLDGIQ
jgi:transcriptional regulator with XRE-family HTH domain